MPLILSGRYLTQRLLGQGGFGAAYYACDRYTPTLRPCVVKLFQPSSQLNPQQFQVAQQLFAREAEVLERLGNQHPQIPDLYAYFPIVIKASSSGKDEEYFYLVQEFIDGEDLEQILDRRGTLPEGAIKAILVSILKVLAFVHKNGAIHRDIKPSNIMKTVDNQLFLLDFGAVKQVTGVVSTKSTGIYTTGYAPPEQVTGGQVFPASDLYSLAVTCVVLLTGKTTTELFDSYSNRWLWQNHVSLQDKTLATVLDKLLSASPQERYASAEDTLKALMGSPAIQSPAALASSPPPPIPVSAPPPVPTAAAPPTAPSPVVVTPSQPPTTSAAQTPSVQTSRPPAPKRFLRLWMLGLLVLLAALAGGGWWLRQRGGLEVRRPQLSTITPAVKFSDVDVTPGQFTYGGSTTWAPIRGIIDPQLQQAIPGLQLTYRTPTNQAPGSSAGIQMLLSGELDFAQTSRPLTPAEKQQAQQLGLTLQEIPVALEGVAIVTHPAISVSNLTQSQLKDVYTGDIVNWQELGGPDLPVVAIAREDLGGTVLFFRQAVLNGEALAPNVRRSPNTTEALRLTGNTPGAIYFASAPEVVGQCTVKPLSIDQQPSYQPPYVDLQKCPNQRNQPNLAGFESGDYPLTRQLYIVSNTEQPIGQAYAALLLSQEGQTALNEAGFAQLR
ncbi:MAG: serine/threonine-protein kinase [Cyanobacteria bacterium P01_B01_bin.77]